MDKWTFSWNSRESLEAFRYFGCHREGANTTFRVWAPGAEKVFVTGIFCGWEPCRFPMEQAAPGIFEASLPAVREYDAYKYVIETADGRQIFKSDPFAVHAETPPGNASKVYDLDGYEWNDAKWMNRRSSASDRPLSLYEIHAGSFRTYASGEPLNYKNLASELIPYVKEMGYSGVCLLPVLEHLDGGSGGYRTTGFFAPTSRYGTPRDFLDFICACHQADLSVWLEWSPEGFPVDDFGLADFTGGRCYEAADDAERQDFRRFDYESPMARGFLLSSALFLLEQCHADGIRVCGSGRTAGRAGGREFLRELTGRIAADFPGVLTAGEDPEAGFSLLWKEEPGRRLLDFAARGSEPPRSTDQNDEGLLAVSQQFLAELGDSLIGWIPGNYEEKFSRLRAAMTVFYAAPGKKLLFMGNEFAQFSPWTPSHELDWMLLDYEMHRKFQYFIRQLNDFYRKTPAMWGKLEGGAFSPIRFPDHPLLLAFSRKDPSGNEFFTLANFGTSEAELLLGVDRRGKYTELFSTDEIKYGGEGRLNGTAFAKLRPAQGKPFCVEAVLPPLSAVYLYKSAGPIRQSGPTSG